MPKTDENLVAHNLLDDSLVVINKLCKNLHLLPGHDSDAYRSTAIKLLISLIYTQKDTSVLLRQLDSNINNQFSGFRLQEFKNMDTSVLNYYNDIMKLRIENPALVSGNYAILDKDNPYICGFERILGKDTLLVIANLTNDVRAFSGNFSYSTLPMLITNYEEGPLPPLNSSIALRPYEFKIYKEN